jgi:two-component system, chemotaxis family, response regulator Rcp1
VRGPECEGVAAKTAKPGKPAKGSGLAILLVDDDAGDCRLVSESLKDSRRTSSLHVVNSGDEALAYLRKAGKARPDIVLLDINMPGKDGFATLREIRATETLTDLPVVMLTTSTAEEGIAASYRLHANCYVSKPSSFADFGEAVREIESFWAETASLPSR